MTDVGAGEVDLFGQCPGNCVCGVRELVTRANERGPRDATDLDAAEMRALLTAIRSGFETVRADPRLVPRRQAALSAYNRAVNELGRLRLTLAEQRLRRAATDVSDAAATVRRRHRRPMWLRWLRWPVVVGIGLFDVWYFSQVFRYLTSQTGDAETGSNAFFRAWETTVAIVPGLVLAVIIAASAHVLQPPLRIWRRAAYPRPAPTPVDAAVPDTPMASKARVGQAIRAVARWSLRLTWWLLPIMFVCLLILVIAVWAGLRAKYPTPPSQGYPLMSVMLLIVMLSLGVIAVKLLADDPDMDELVAARRRLRGLRWSYLRRSRAVDRRIGAYEAAWSDLSTLRADLAGLLRIKMLSAWEGFILRVRSLHRMNGNVVATDATEAGALARREFVDVPQPAMELGPLHEICRLVDDRRPEELREQKQLLDEEFAAQVNGSAPS